MASPSDETSFRAQLQAQAKQYEKQLEDLRRRPAKLTLEVDAAKSEAAQVRRQLESLQEEQERLLDRIAAGIHRRTRMLNVLNAFLRHEDDPRLVEPMRSALRAQAVFEARGLVSAEMLARQAALEKQGAAGGS